MRKIVEGVKDSKGSFLPPAPIVTVEPPKPEVIPSTISIDSMLNTSLTSLYRILRHINGEISSPAGPNRETIQNLKDVMTMLHELKKKEQDLLTEISDEELEKLSKK